ELNQMCKRTDESGSGSNWKCCPRDWLMFGGSCYFFSSDAMNWMASEDNCSSLGAHLIVITSREEQEELIQQHVRVPYWIGLTDQGSEGSWRWVDGTPYNHPISFWIESNPNNRAGNENCGTVGGWSGYRALRWNDHNCESSLNRICEKTAST
uniref:C-type lectin domain-containing protein n=1 Tax=Latimeria chalumnae TaxID=7897 RepID=H3A069_LATCH